MYQPIANKKKRSFKLMTTENRKWKDATLPIGLMLNFSRQRKLITPDISAHPQHWCADFERFTVTGSKSHPNALQFNTYLDSLVARIGEITSDYIRRKIPFTDSMHAKQLFVDTKTTKLKEYIKDFIENLESQECFGHATTFKCLLLYLEKFDKSLDRRLFADVNYDYVCKFVQSQLKNGQKKAGISINIRALRTILNSAIEDNVGSPGTYPFSNRYGTMTGKKIFNVTRQPILPWM